MSDGDWIPLNWPERDGLQIMPDSARTIVLSYIWKHINRITDEIDNGRHDELYLKKVGRRIADADKNEIRSWRNHIEDDFVVVNHVPHKGSLFVQVGRVAAFEQKGLPGPIQDDSDIHDPRVFFVQGLATPMKEMCETSHNALVKTYPSLKKYDLPISFLHTTILPFNGGLTYAVTAEQTNRSYYETAQQYAAAVKIAHDCYKSTVLKNQVTSIELKCKLYDTITTDIVRQAKDKASANASYAQEKRLREEFRPDDRHNDPEMTCLNVHGMIWMPFANSDGVNDPRTVNVINEVMSERPLKEVREGFKHRIVYEVWFNDHEPCPFHRRMGADTTPIPSFAECCKKDHLKRVAKARKREESLICSYLYNPVEEEEAECISRDPVARQQILSMIRIGPFDVSDVRLRVPLSYLDEVKWRMDNAQIYLPVIDSGVEYKWIYLGWIPVAVGGAGLLSFGDITLNTETGVFAATAMTADRCAALITRMKILCSYGEAVGKGIPVEDISLIGTQMGKSKPDKTAMSRNVEQLKEDFDIKASMAIDKVSRTFRRCQYCGKTEEVENDDFKLLQCLCKKYYYCSKQHQKLNWKDHKATCLEIREGK